LAAAPAGAVLVAVRALLDGWEASQDTTPAAAVRPPQAAWRANDNGGAAEKPAKLPASAVAPPAKVAQLAAWEQLRLGSMRRPAASATK
jgi:hypothetical protein